MSTFEPFAIALRLSGLTLPQFEAEKALKQLLVRYEAEDADGSFYGQVDVPVTNAVRAILELADRSGPVIEAMLADRRLGGAVTVHETIRVKSAAWDPSGVLLYRCWAGPPGGARGGGQVVRAC